jgi:hypothetical protein
MDLNSDKIKIKDLLELKANNMISVNPEYQRGAVWNEAQQKKLIDSVLRSYPLPLIYLHHKKKTVAGMQREDLEIIDGQQRINALFRFGESAFKLFDPIKDDKKARFPDFIKRINCPWAGCDFLALSQDLKDKFNNTELFIVKVTTDIEDEARDLFIRLQAGLPLNAQEKRDAWPGGYTEFVLKFGGKSEITRFPGHQFFRTLVGLPKTDRGATRTLCAQVGMLFFEKANQGNWMDIGSQQVDDYYYRNLGFDVNSAEVLRFSKVLDLAVEVFEGFKGPKLKVHEAIHVFLLLDSLMDDYTRSWQDKFIQAFEQFRLKSAIDKKEKAGEYWSSYVSWTMTQAVAAYSLQRRHKFFSEKMYAILTPVKKDPNRIYGELEREIIYYGDDKKCAVCGEEIKWTDLEIHHIDEHQNGGQTTIENGVPVHKGCHPKGQAAIDFNNNWKANKQQIQGINNAILNEKLKESSLDANSFQDLKKQLNSKSPTPSASDWANKIPELQGINNIHSWADICSYFNINVNGNSARRALKKWVEVNQPEWEAVPEA